ncbi:MAG: hypothetical protein H7X70_06395 [Candidatus Kapabacteria bacterium]|nr:hypothetical protein [Candidatus Kapabacteria bacterium]
MKSLLILCALSLIVTSCTIINQAPPIVTPQTQLQTREIQTREFDTNDVKLIMKAMLNVLQDDGFVVKNAVPDLGLLTATKEIQITGGNNGGGDQFWSEVFESVFKSNKSSRNTPTNRQEQRYNKFKQIEVSINISELGRRSKVRANFQAKILDNVGSPVEVYPIQDPKYYQEFFTKVDKGIFIQKQGF